jgi:uncharacterized repeat protein (TIGR01451 family)
MTVKRSRLLLAIAVLCTLGIGVYWAYGAQHGQPLWAPPPVLPTEKGAVVIPGPTRVDEQPVSKAAPIKKAGANEEKSKVIQAGGALPAPPPMFPAPARMPEKKEIDAPPPLPQLDETKPALEPRPVVIEPAFPPLPKKDVPLPVAPVPQLEPEKVLIKDPPTKIIPPPFPPMEPSTKLIPLPEFKADPPTVTIPPAAVVEEPKKPVGLVPQIEPKIMPQAQSPVAPTPPEDRVKSFVRVRSGPVPAAPPPPPVVRDPVPEPPQPGPAAQSAAPPPTANALSRVQVPAVTLEKRGPSRLSAHESAVYQLVIRNLGPSAAPQIQIDDEIPAGARIASADPMPQMQVNKAIWVIPGLAAGQEQVIRITLQAKTPIDVSGQTTLQVSSASVAKQTSAYQPTRATGDVVALRVKAPAQAAVGAPVVFEIQVGNQADQPLQGIVLHAILPDGLSHPEGREIQGPVDAAFKPGETKTIRMPTTAAKAGRHSVQIKVVTKSGVEVSDVAHVDVIAAGVLLQQEPTTRLFPGRHGDVRIELANHTGKPLKNIMVSNRLADGLDFVDASDRGLYQSNSRTVHWVVDQLPAGKTQTLFVRLRGNKAGQYPNLVLAKADGMASQQSNGMIVLEALSDLALRVVAKDNQLEMGRETVYEVHVQNPGNTPASNVKLQVQFPPGLTPKDAQGETRHAIERHAVHFEPVASLSADGKLVYRVSAIAHAAGDQRVRFAVVSDQVRAPVEREISTMVYRD